MNNFNLNLFKYFYYVAYYNGFTNASKALNVAQSSLSYNIKQLESQLDKKLIIRNNKRFELTEDGNNLYENLQSAFNILNKNIEQYEEHNVTEINIGIRHYLADFIFKDAIEQFVKLYPNIQVNITLYSKLDLKKFEDELDFIIDYEDYTNLINNDKKIFLCSLENTFVVGKGLYENYNSISSITELAEEKIISMCPNKKNGKFQKMCFENGILFKKSVSINDSFLCKKLVKNNLGLCFANKEYFKNEIVNGDVKELNLIENIFNDEIFIAYKKGKNNTNITKFIKILKEQYEEE